MPSEREGARPEEARALPPFVLELVDRTAHFALFSGQLATLVPRLVVQQVWAEGSQGSHRIRPSSKVSGHQNSDMASSRPQAKERRSHAHPPFVRPTTQADVFAAL